MIKVCSVDMFINGGVVLNYSISGLHQQHHSQHQTTTALISQGWTPYTLSRPDLSFTPLAPPVSPQAGSRRQCTRQSKHKTGSHEASQISSQCQGETWFLISLLIHTCNCLMASRPLSSVDISYFISILSSNLSILLFLLRYLMLIFVRSLSYQQFSIIIENKKQLHECEECAENVFIPTIVAGGWEGRFKHLNISSPTAPARGI